MPKTKSTYLVLYSLYINALMMGIYAFSNFSEGDSKLAAVFTLVSLLIVSMAISGTILIGKTEVKK